MSLSIRFSSRNAALLGATSALALLLVADPALAVASKKTPVIDEGSVVVSTTTYDNSQGAIANLKIGTTLPNKATSTTSAIAGNDYVSTWNNVSVDAAYGVTSPIQLLDIDASTGAILHSVTVPADQVVTSFSSKSELGLHITGTGATHHIYFVGYAGAGIGAIDASNSDAVPGQDPTNPVTFAFGSNYAFKRTIVSMNTYGQFAYTPTTAYGGNNGRSVVRASDGLYYAVGNANNGNASTFGSSNGTNPDVTETTGLIAVNPIDGANIAVAIPANNSAEVDPLIQYNLTGKPDKPGKDDNYRGITEFAGALYFSKGSGSNGMDTIYTVSGPSLPSVSQAPAATISVVPGFPTDAAKTTNGNFTPFGIFFANATTMYVADEGTGNATLDGTTLPTHAGLEKWSLVGDTWQLDYVLTNGLIGTTDNITGPDGDWPTITTTGLRGLTGVKNGDGTVTLWATTSTSSASGDNGADPNKVVKITDKIRATSLSDKGIAAEAFQTVLGPTYGTVYRGVAYAK